MPAGQGLQVDTAVAPIVVENVPARHKLHTAEEEAPFKGEYFPATQLMQLSAPKELLYCPDAHAEHPPPRGAGTPVYPGEHRHTALPS